MTSPFPFATVQAPTVDPAPYGLYTAATIIPEWDETWRNGVQYLSNNCTKGFTWSNKCGYSQGTPTPPVTRTITVIFTGAKTGTDPDFTFTGTVKATVNGGDAREVKMDYGPTDIDMTTGAAETTFHSGTSALTGLAVVFTDVKTGTTKNVTLNQAVADGAITPATVAFDVSDPQPPTPTDPKLLYGAALITANPFTVGDGVECNAVGVSNTEADARARLASSEQRNVAREFWQGKFGALPHLAETDSTQLGTAAVSVLEALALIEERLGTFYPGRGIIHAPRYLAPYFARYELVVRANNRLETPLGTRWAFDGGYDLNTGPSGEKPSDPDKEHWIYATGEVVIRRSPVSVYATFDIANNLDVVVAERTIVITRECETVAALVDVTK